MRFLPFTASLLFTYHLSLGQNITIQGKVVDKTTNEKLPFAHVYFENTSFGTVSNADGKFYFVIPKDYWDKPLIFSSLGYKSLKMDIQNQNREDFELVFLEESPIQLEGVVVSTISAKEIWMRAAKQYNKLYKTPSHRAQGFYRTTFQEDGYFTRLLEAAVNLHGGGTPKSKAKIEYVQIRKSHDLRQNIWTIYDGYLEHLVWNHPIRTKSSFLTTGGINRYEFEVVKQQYRDEELFYVIKATGPENGMHDVEMIIRDKDYAIFQITLFWHPENSNNYSWAWEYREDEKFFSDWQTSIYEYDEYAGKMFLKRASWHRKGKVVGRADGETRFFTESIDELLITNVDLGKYDFQSKVPVEVQDIYEMANYFAYDSDFWEIYNKPVDSEYFKNAKSKMESYSPLDQQFASNTDLKTQ